MTSSPDPPNARATPAEAGLASGARLVVRTGRPTAEELAALVLAVDAERARGGDAPARRPASRPSAWQRAARLESAGIGQLAAPGDVDVARSRRHPEA